MSAFEAGSVCQRSEEVRSAILTATGVGACADVTEVDLEGITELDLSDQSMTSLAAGDFAHLVRLRTLDLSNNALTSLAADVFEPLVLLETLRLHNNALTTVPSDAFDSLLLLDELSLHGNSFTTLPEGLFDGLSRFAGMSLTAASEPREGTALLQGFLDDNGVTSVEGFVEALPDLYKQRFVMVYESAGLGAEFVSSEHPRMVSHGADGRLLLAWLTNPDAEENLRDSVEFLTMEADSTEWTAGVVDFGGETPAIRQPRECSSCHGALNKPLWGHFGFSQPDGQGGSRIGRALGTEASSDLGYSDLRRRLEVLTASENRRIAPMDFSATFVAGGVPRSYTRREDMADVASEMAAMVAWGHGRLLFNRLRARSDWEETLLPRLLCDSQFAIALQSEVSLADRNPAYNSATLELLQSSGLKEDFADLYGYQLYAYMEFSMRMLFLQDAWDRSGPIRSILRSGTNTAGNNAGFLGLMFPRGTATQRDELLQIVRMFFGHGNNASLLERSTREGTRSSVFISQQKYIDVVCRRMRANELRRLTSSLEVAEGSRRIGELEHDRTRGHRPQTPVWSLVPASDHEHFTLSPEGALAFTAAKDFEAPDDANGDGRYELTVRAENDWSLATEELSVRLRNVNEPPVADAGADQTEVAEGARVELVGSAQDPDGGDAVTYRWTQTGGASVTLSGDDQSTASFDAPEGLVEFAVLTFELTVTDSGGNGATDTVSVTVAPTIVGVSVAEVTSRILEGEAAEFRFTMDRTKTEPLTVAVRVSDEGSALAGEAPAEVAFEAGAVAATLVLATVGDGSLEDPAEVTATVVEGEPYLVGSPSSATVSVEPHSDDATLSSLALSGLDIGAFESSSGEYAASAAHAVTSTTVTANVSDSEATLAFTPADEDTEAAGHQVNLAEGETRILAQVTAEDGATTRIYTAIVTRAPPPLASVEAAQAQVEEGSAARFKVTLVEASPSPLTVTLMGRDSSVAADQGMSPTLTLSAGETTGMVDVPVALDRVVDSERSVTVTLAAGSGYRVGSPATAEVAVADATEATFEVAISQQEIVEGRAATVTVSVADGVTFSQDQEIALAVGGTASASDYALSPGSPTLSAAAASTTATLSAVRDSVEEDAETLTITASHGGTSVGAVSLSIIEAAADASLSVLSLSGVDFGAYSSGVTEYAATVEASVASTTVTATASDSYATVEILPVDADAALGHQVALQEGVTGVSVAVTSADGQTLRTYSVSVTRSPEGFVVKAGVRPHGLWSDGETMWIVGSRGQMTFCKGSISAWDLATKQVRPERGVPEPTVCGNGNYWPWGLWSDGETLWSSDRGPDPKLYAYSLSGGLPKPSRNIDLDPDNATVLGIWGDGETIWAVDPDADKAFAYRLSDGARGAAQEALDVSLGDVWQRGLWSDGSAMWVVDARWHKLVAYRSGDHASELDIDLNEGNTEPRGVWSDGRRVWVSDEGSGKLYAYFLPRPSPNARLTLLRVVEADIGAFSPSRTQYEGEVSAGKEEVTLVAFPAAGANLVVSPGDSDDRTPGHQVSLSADQTSIEVRVTAADGKTTETYAVTVTRPEPVEVAPPSVSVSGGASPVTEGTAAEFTLTLSESLSESLSVSLSVTEDGSVLSGTPPTSVRFDSGSTTATLSVATEADSAVESDSTLTLTLASGDGYELGTPSSASVTVADDDEPFTARFSAVPPTHDGNERFTFELHFSLPSSEDLSLSYTTLRDDSLVVANGSVHNARRLSPPSDIAWEITIEPASENDITITLPARSDCAASGAICTTNGKPLSTDVSATVENDGEPFTARFSAVPPTHDGSEERFTFELHFSLPSSENLSLSYRTLRDHSFVVANGSVHNARRLSPPSDIEWEITIEPDSEHDITITLPARSSCTATGAICTTNGTPLSTDVSATVEGPADPEEPSDDASLGSLSLSEIDIGTFSSEATTYSADVGNDVQTTTVTAEASDAEAVVSIDPADGNDVTMGHQVTLLEDENEISVTVEAEDGETTRTYTVTVTRAGTESTWGERKPHLDLESSLFTDTCGIWSDGETLLVISNRSSGTVSAFDLAGNRVPAKDLTANGTRYAVDLWSDGETMWVADYYGGIRAYSLADGERVPDQDFGSVLSDAGNNSPSGIWSNGETMWVADSSDAKVYAYSLSTKSRQEGLEFSLRSEVRASWGPYFGLWSDGATMLSADWTGSSVVAYRLADGGALPALDIDTPPSGDGFPVGLAVAGGTLWVADESESKLLAYAAPSAAMGSGQTESSAGPPEWISSEAASLSSDTVWIRDRALRARVAAALGKPIGAAIEAEEMASLRVLKARNAGVVDLAGLEQAIGLRELDLGFNRLRDLGQLSSLPSLESLNLDGAAHGLWPLSSLSGLRRLSLRHNKIADLSPLAGLVALQELDIRDNAVEDLSPLSVLNGLSTLRADRNLVSDLHPLAPLAALRELSLSWNRVESWGPLEVLDRLETLRLHGNGLRELSALPVLPDLRELGLADNGIADVRALSHWRGLRRLDLRANPIRDLRPLSALDGLVLLHLGGSGVKDLSPLEGLPALTVLGATQPRSR